MQVLFGSKMLTFIILNMCVLFSIFHFDPNIKDLIVDGKFYDIINQSPEFGDFRTIQTVSATGQEGISSVVLV